MGFGPPRGGESGILNVNRSPGCVGEVRTGVGPDTDTGNSVCCPSFTIDL